jgi:sulfur-oxidizing protein SoxX
LIDRSPNAKVANHPHARIELAHHGAFECRTYDNHMEELQLKTSNLILSIGFSCIPAVLLAAEAPPETPTPKPEKIEAYQSWKNTDFSIAAPLGGLKGDAVNGRKVAIHRGKGNCLACHQMPIPEEEFHGEIGPPLMGVGGRYDEGQIRLRIVNMQEINPGTLMPPFYKHPDQFNRVSKQYQGRTILTAQEVEDVVAYLMTLK